MRRLLLLAGLLGVLAAGCSNTGDRAPEPEPSNTAEAEEADAEPEGADSEGPEVPDPEPDPDPVAVAPMTGQPIEDEDDLERPVAAVKIDNHPAARPPTGLEHADVTFTALVEGGATRFIALYHATDPGEIGPIRSGREADADLLPAFDPVVGISGAAPPVYRDFAEAGLTVFEEGQAGGAFVRDAARRAPHNLFVSVGNLWAAAGDVPAATEPWEIDVADIPDAEPADPPEGGEAVDGLDLRFSLETEVSWARDDDLGWVRTQDGEPQLTDEDEQLHAANVVVARIPITVGDRVDASGAPTQNLGVVGEGEALVLRDGRAYEARWRKDDATEQFVWETLDGDPIPLAAGRTWVELVPDDGEATTRSSS